MDEQPPIRPPWFDEKLSYRRALEVQARLLAKALAGGFAQDALSMTR